MFYQSPSNWLLLLVALVASLAFPQTGAGQSDPKVGDIVEYQMGPNLRQGKVIEIRDNGWVKIEIEINGHKMSPVIPPRLIKIVRQAKSSPAEKNRVRTWQDRSGRFEVKAELLDQNETRVKLKKEDGGVIDVPLDQLSETDLKYLKDKAAETDDENPFAGGVYDSPPAETEPSADRSLKTPTAPDRNSAEQIVLADTTWNVATDARADLDSTAKRRAVGLPNSGFQNPVHNRHSPMSISFDESAAAVSVYNPFDKGKSKIQVLDLIAGEVRCNVELPLAEIEQVELSPDGKILVARQKSFGSRAQRVDFFAVQDDQLQQLVAWEMKQLHHVRFLDFDRLLTTTSDGTIEIWNWSRSEALQKIATGAQTEPALSANHRLLAVYKNETVFLVDLDGLLTVGQLPYQAGNSARFAFSPDGQSLAGWYAGEMTLWNLQNGQRIGSVSLPGDSVGGSLLWVGNSHLLVGGRDLFSTKLNTVVWTYTGSRPVLGGAGGFWYLARELNQGDGTIVPVTLPNPGLAKAEARFDPEELVVLQPGSRFTVEIELPFNPGERRQVKTALENNLQAAGFEVSRSGSEFVLRAYSQTGKQQTQSYGDLMRPGFFGRGSTNVTYTPTTSVLEITRDGQVIWSRSVHNTAPSIIREQEGKSIQQAVSEHCRPQPAFFKNSRLPRNLSRLPNNRANLGTTKLTSSGPR